MERFPPARRCARAQQARVLRLLPRESQRSGAQAHYTRKPPHEVRARAGTWEHGLAPKEGGCSLVRCPSVAHRKSAASAARCACATSARAAPLPQRELAQWRASALHAQATSRNEARVGTWEHSLAPKVGRLLARAVPFQGAWSDCRQRGAERACSERACCASSLERASAVARKRTTRASHLSK